MPQNPHVLLPFDKVHNPLPRETTSERPKAVRTCGVFEHFDFEMCFAPQQRALFNISTPKSALNPLVINNVNTFDFEMWFAPQQRALFRYLNFQKCSEPRCVLYILTCRCASPHNGVQFFISHLPRRLRTRRFGVPTLRHAGATNHWKNTVFRGFATFSRACIFCLLTLSLL